MNSNRYFAAPIKGTRKPTAQYASEDAYCRQWAFFMFDYHLNRCGIMRQSTNSKMQLLFMLALTMLLLAQFGVALLHHHHQGSYYDHKDQFHHVTIEAPCPGKVSVRPIPESNRPNLTSAVIAHHAFLKRPAVLFVSPPTSVRLRRKPRAAGSAHDRAPPA
jgi:hypothetical protein